MPLPSRRITVSLDSSKGEAELTATAISPNKLLKLLRVLAEPHRFSLMLLLAQRGRSRVKELAAELPIDLSVVSRHLRLLAELSVVTVTHSGRAVYYSLNREWLLEQLAALAELIKRPEGR